MASSQLAKDGQGWAAHSPLHLTAPSTVQGAPDQSCLRGKRQVWTGCIRVENSPLLEMSLKGGSLRSPPIHSFIHTSSIYLAPTGHLLGTYWVPSTLEVLRIAGKMTVSLLWHLAGLCISPKPPKRKIPFKEARASLVAQWLRICLPMQGTRVRALVWEDPTCRGATRPVSHNYWACASGACAPQQERPRRWEARAPRWRVAPICRN